MGLYKPLLHPQDSVQCRHILQKWLKFVKWFGTQETRTGKA